MLSEQVDKWERDLLARGREEGFKQGFIEGREEGFKQGLMEALEEASKQGLMEGREEGKKTILRETLQGLILQKFGQVTLESLRSQIDGLEQSEQLQKTCLKLLGGSSVEELFDFKK